MTPVASNRLPVLSVVIPLFEEATTVPVLVDRLARVLDDLGVAAEVILVDDGSGDETLAEIERAHEADGRFLGLALSRNFGHQVAITAGLRHARGAAVVVMDGDLQDPPEAIPALWDRWNDGFDVVYAVRASRPEAAWKRLAYAGFYRLLGRASAIAIPLDSGDFGIMSRRVVDLLNAMPERRRFVRGLRAWVGFRQVGLAIDRGERHAGAPKFTVGKLVGLAIDGLIGFGEAPLRAVGGLGFVSMLASVVGVVLGTVGGATGWCPLPGWGWAVCAAGFFGGAQLVCGAILGEYLGRIAQQVNGRPLYVVRRRVGLGKPAAKGGVRLQGSTGRRVA